MDKKPAYYLNVHQIEQDAVKAYRQEVYNARVNARVVELRSEKPKSWSQKWFGWFPYRIIIERK